MEIHPHNAREDNDMASLATEMQRIRDRHGDLTPELTVETATPVDHPLHPRFEWDDTIAGHQHRLAQAARLIRAVKFRPVACEPATLRSYVNVRQPDRGRGSYMPTQEALEDPLTRKLVLQDMEREWRTLHRRWGHMQEFADLIRRDLAS